MNKCFGLLVGAMLALPTTMPAQAGEISKGESIYGKSCAQCHGRAGKGSGSFPSLTGLEEAKIVTLLETYRSGERVGPNSALMRAPAQSLSDDDIADLAAFISTRFQE